jgi:hypothetical protein
LRAALQVQAWIIWGQMVTGMEKTQQFHPCGNLEHCPFDQVDLKGQTQTPRWASPRVHKR